MPFTVDELAEAANSKGLRLAYLAGYNDKGEFVFLSTHGEQPELRAIHAEAGDYIEGRTLLQPERRHTVSIPRKVNP
jgi:hypothetical protein